MAWYQPQTSIVPLMQLSRVVLWMKNAPCMTEIKNTKYNLQNVSFF